MRWLLDRPRTTYVVLFFVGFAVYAAVSGDRLARQSPDPHFVLQADAWLHGKLTIDAPWKGDDPAKVETVLLKDGSEVRGRYLHTRGWTVGTTWFEQQITQPSPKRPRLPTTRLFRTTRGKDIPESEIQKSLGIERYVSFPPVPSILMLPQTAIHGRIANDVFPTLLIAALILPLCFATLKRLVAAGLSERSEVENLWLTALLSFGTVLFFVSVQGRVWFTAHVVGVALAMTYAYFAIEARRPLLAGLFLGLATLSRTPMAFMFPLFALEAWRVSGGFDDWRANWRTIAKLWLKFSVPVVLIAIAAGIHNYLRFDSFGEFGHSYLAVRQQAMIEVHGLFDYEYLRRNLSVALSLLPRIEATAPYVHISGHGMALWITTPLFVTLLWPRVRGRIHQSLWLAAALIAVPILCYQNSGWFQFGYRFSLDYTVLLILLLAVGGRPLTRVSKGLIIFSMLVNLFGAYTFARYPQFYDGGDYNAIISHQPK